MECGFRLRKPAGFFSEEIILHVECPNCKAIAERPGIIGSAISAIGSGIGAGLEGVAGLIHRRDSEATPPSPSQQAKSIEKACENKLIEEGAYNNNNQQIGIDAVNEVEKRMKTNHEAMRENPKTNEEAMHEINDSLRLLRELRSKHRPG